MTIYAHASSTRSAEPWASLVLPCREDSSRSTPHPACWVLLGVSLCESGCPIAAGLPTVHAQRETHRAVRREPRLPETRPLASVPARPSRREERYDAPANPRQGCRPSPAEPPAILATLAGLARHGASHAGRSRPGTLQHRRAWSLSRTSPVAWPRERSTHAHSSSPDSPSPTHSGYEWLLLLTQRPLWMLKAVAVVVSAVVRTTKTPRSGDRFGASWLVIYCGQGRGRTADLPLFRRTLVPTELPDLERS